ncbi:MAG TPA: hypothetical protein PLF13_03590 [candidate division Zixibacteria bacterium]|nr:hypothetical protein [candidate division Zixibacteria bacterium]
MRKLSDSFLSDLASDDGLLHAILERVKQDHTLMLAVRSDYINIYYRGGNLMRIEENKSGSYRCNFNTSYNQTGFPLPELPEVVESVADVAAWVGSFPQIKQVMDIWFSSSEKSEREFQQLIARENNFSNIANASEYFISDIEFADSELHARFDMLAVRWLATQRRTGANCRPALIEVKYGDGALGGTAGMKKHLEDMDQLIADRDRYAAVLETTKCQFDQLDQLGLLRFRHSARETEVSLDPDDKPEVIFVLANHNPRSSKLASILNDPEVLKYGRSDRFDLRFFVAGFAGYGFHARCMLDLDVFRKLL